jgi:hypothetical protein
MLDKLASAAFIEFKTQLTDDKRFAKGQEVQCTKLGAYRSWHRCASELSPVPYARRSRGGTQPWPTQSERRVLHALPWTKPNSPVLYIVVELAGSHDFLQLPALPIWDCSFRNFQLDIASKRYVRV